MSTAQIDAWAREEIASRGARASPLGYQGYPAAICTSRNHVVCHDVASRCLEAGIAAARSGGRLGDIGHAIEELAQTEGCGVVAEFGGHGIGRRMHMPPHVAHTGRAGTGLRLRPGLAFTIEPMITIGHPRVIVLDDGWTAVTGDRSPTAQFEHTLLVTEDGIEVLTRSRSPDLTTHPSRVE